MMQPEQAIKAIEDMKTIEDIKAIEAPAETELVHPPTSPQQVSSLGQTTLSC